MQSILPSMPKPSGGFMGKRIKIPTAPDIFGEKEQTTASGYKRLSNDERIKRNLEAAAVAAEKENPNLAACLRTMSPVMTLFVKGVLVLIPIYEYIFKWCIYLYYVLPKNALLCIFGLTLCFFGGPYLAVFAAIEGFAKMGWERAYADILVIYDALKEVEKKSAEDDDQDLDNDGIADVDQIPPDELLKRKVKVAMKAVKDPSVVQSAIGSFWSAYLAVLATLKLQFARTTAIALGIASMIKFPIVRAVGPLLAQGLGKDLGHWAKTIVDTTINFIVIIFAWYLQMVISAFYSGLRGGKIFSDAFFALLQENGILDKAPDWLIKNKPYDPDESYLDEIVMYIVFAAGFSYQLLNNFAIPFPFNVILFPVTLLEWILRWQVTFENAGV